MSVLCDICKANPVSYIVVAPWNPSVPIISICDLVSGDGVSHKCLQEYASKNSLPSATIEYDIYTYEKTIIVHLDD